MVLDYYISSSYVKQEQKRNGSRCIYSGYESSSEIEGNWVKMAEAFDVLHA